MAPVQKESGRQVQLLGKVVAWASVGSLAPEESIGHDEVETYILKFGRIIIIVQDNDSDGHLDDVVVHRVP